MDAFILYDHENIKYIRTLDICFSYNVKRIIMLFCIYFIGMFTSRRFKIQKRHQLVTNIISTLCSYYAVCLGSTHTLPDYYIYDLILSLFTQDWLMITHHIFTLYCLSFCPFDPDYSIINNITLLIKLGDMFVNHYKITDALDLYEIYPVGVRSYQMVSILLTMILWIPIRLLLPFWIYPFNSKLMNILAVTLHCINFYWMNKFRRLLIRIGKETTNHLKLEDNSV